MHAKEKQEIIKEFNSIKEKLKICIDANEAESLDEQLPIQSFNLDVDGTHSVIELARQGRQFEHCRMKQFCAEQNELIDWIKGHTWNLIEIKSTKLRGIFTRLCVENYALHYPDEVREKELRRIHFWRSRERMASSNDVFYPWMPRTIAQLEEQLNLVPRLARTDESILDYLNSTTDRAISITSANRSQESQLSLRSQTDDNFALSGTSTHLYVKPLRIRYSQLEVVSYNQMYAEHQMGLVSYRI